MAQLSGLHYLLETGQVPTVDFAVWGPHGNRIERKLRLSGSVFSSDGSLRTIEIAGPPTIAIWLASWEVFATAAILLDIMDLGTLMAYKDHIMRMHNRYGPTVWLLLYQTDTRFRAEHILRWRRKLADAHVLAANAGGTTQFDTNRPWNQSMIEGIEDSKWWFVEFTEPAMMILARTANIQALVSNEAPVSSAWDNVVVDEASTSFRPQGKGHSMPQQWPIDNKRKRDIKGDMSKISDGAYTNNRSGTKLCAAFQTGACGASVGDHLCPSDRTSKHQCNKCLGMGHGGARCSSGSAPRHKADKGQGKSGKGKSKGKSHY